MESILQKPALVSAETTPKAFFSWRRQHATPASAS